MPIKITLVVPTFAEYFYENRTKFGFADLTNYNNRRGYTKGNLEFWISEEESIVRIFTTEVKLDLGWLEEIVLNYEAVLKQRGCEEIKPVEVKLVYKISETKKKR